MKNITCIEDLRQVHKRNTPKMFFDYVDHGSYAEETLRANRTDLEDIKFRQRILVDISQRDLGTTILGEAAALPLILAPVGSTGMQYGDGEIHACRAAQAAGIPFTLSTMSINSIEDVAESVEKPFWFQLYVMKDRGFVKALIERAIAAKCSALVLTVDLQVLGQRHADIKNGLSVPPQLFRLKNMLDMASKPRWVMGILGGKQMNFGNITGHMPGSGKTNLLPDWADGMLGSRGKRSLGNIASLLPGSNDLSSVSEWVASQFDASLNWKDVDWIRSIWPGKLIIKGILDVEDANEAVKTGAQALVVSNHGGRQLDGAPSSISVLPEIADVVGSQIEVMMDGGIRSGQDVMRALALGAKSCMIGRAYVHGLGAYGQAGVAKAIDIIRNEFSVTMGLCGVNKIADIDDHVLAL